MPGVIPCRLWGPYEEGRFVPVVSVLPGPKQTYRVLGEVCVIVYTHFLLDIPPRGRDIPHLADTSVCPGCQRFQRPRCKPFLACWADDVSRHILLQLSTDCLRHLPCLQPSSGEIHRGRRITVWRDGRSATSPVRASLSEPDPDGLSWPIGADELAILARLWGVEEAGLVLAEEAA